MVVEEKPSRDKVAVFWDYENARVWAEGIQVPLADKIMSLALEYGHPKVLKAYGKWGKNETIAQGLYSMGIQTIHVPMDKKNSVDVMLAVDCIACKWENPEIDVYVIVTGDKDYISVVNYLKAHEKHVLVVGPSEISSDHLQLSASEFYSFEDLAEETESITPKIEWITGTITLDEATKCLLKAIAKAKELGKTTRFPVIDSIMRMDKTVQYRGYQSIIGPEDVPFSSFGQFIDYLESKSKIVVYSSGEFAEIFLPTENPVEESSFSPIISDIESKHWAMVLERIEKAFQEGDPSKYLYGRFHLLYFYARSLKKEGTLNLTNRTFQMMVERIIEEGLLTRQADDSYRLTDNYDSLKKDFLNRITK